MNKLIIYADRVLVSIGSAFVFLFFLLLTLKLNGNLDVAWYIVMTPLFLLKAIGIVAPFLLTFFSCSGSQWMARNSWWYTNPADYCRNSIYITLFFLCPLLVFEILIAQHLQERQPPSYALVFIPFYLVEIFGLLAFFIANLKESIWYFQD